MEDAPPAGLTEPEQREKVPIGVSSAKKGAKLSGIIWTIIIGFVAGVIAVHHPGTMNRAALSSPPSSASSARSSRHISARPWAGTASAKVPAWSAPWSVPSSSFLGGVPSRAAHRRSRRSARSPVLHKQRFRPRVDDRRLEAVMAGIEDRRGRARPRPASANCGRGFSPVVLNDLIIAGLGGEIRMSLCR